MDKHVFVSVSLDTEDTDAKLQSLFEVSVMSLSERLLYFGFHNFFPVFLLMSTFLKIAAYLLHVSSDLGMQGCCHANLFFYSVGWLSMLSS